MDNTVDILIADKIKYYKEELEANKLMDMPHRHIAANYLKLIIKDLEQLREEQKPDEKTPLAGMTPEQFFEGSPFTLDFLEPAERQTFYNIMEIYGQGCANVALSKREEQPEALRRFTQDQLIQTIEAYREGRTCLGGLLSDIDLYTIDSLYYFPPQTKSK